MHGTRTRVLAAGHPLAIFHKARRSVSGRLMLVVLATTAIALLFAGTALLLTDLRVHRQASANDLDTQTSILALATRPALAFQDRETAQRNLDALDVHDAVRSAALYGPDGSLYASYLRTGEARPASAPALEPGVHIDRTRIEVVRRIVQNGELLGTLYLRAQYDVWSRVQAYAGIIVTVMLLALGVGLLASAWLRSAITRPLDSMAGVARGIVERRDYSLRAKKTTDDELGLVVDAFNSMLDEVQTRARALEESEKLYRAIGESIDYGVWVCDASGRNIYASDSFLRLCGMTQEQCSDFRWGEKLHPEDREATIAAWREAVREGTTWYREHRVLGTDGEYHPILAQGVPIRDDEGRVTRWAGINLDISRVKQTEAALRDADRRKDEFLATLAHELRNPLAPIQNAVRILELPSSDERQRRWGREVIARQVRHMALLLDDLLDVSRITRGQLELRKDFVWLDDILEMAVETARPLIAAKQHELTVDTPQEPVRLEVDPLRLSQVVANLLTNAAKYTDPGGRIAVTASLVDEGLVISVKDTGIGLSADHIPRLFTIFSQVNSSIDRAEGGLGIGLSLVKGLVALHGGDVEVRSEGLGRGSEFIVKLPKGRVVSAPAHASDADGQPQLTRGPTLGKVLIADDNRDAVETLSTVLHLSGYETLVAYSGAEALEVASREHPSAILLDIGMPGMTGHEAARRIRREAWGRRVLLVAVTGWGQEEDRARTRAAGFDRHLTKPVDPTEVDRILAEYFSGGSDPSRLGSATPATERTPNR